MRVTLTEDGCTYEGDTTPAPGSFNIKVENKTSHYANFTMSALLPGTNVEDLQHAVEQARRAIEQGKEPGPGVRVGRGAGGARTGPHETKVIPVNESSGRFVIACWVHNTAAGLSDFPGPPAALYVVPVELDVR